MVLPGAALRLSSARRAQVERGRELGGPLLGGNLDESGAVSMVLKSSQAAGFRFEGIDREGLVVATARMGYVIDAAAERATRPAIDQVEGERNIDGKRRMKS